MNEIDSPPMLAHNTRPIRIQPVCIRIRYRQLPTAIGALICILHI
jgi:hypothetical protein